VLLVRSDAKERNHPPEEGRRVKLGLPLSRGPRWGELSVGPLLMGAEGFRGEGSWRGSIKF